MVDGFVHFFRSPFLCCYFSVSFWGNFRTRSVHTSIWTEVWNVNFCIYTNDLLLLEIQMHKLLFAVFFEKKKIEIEIDNVIEMNLLRWIDCCPEYKRWTVEVYSKMIDYVLSFLHLIRTTRLQSFLRTSAEIWFNFFSVEKIFAWCLSILHCQ